ncbi:alpha/beta hydrolase [uncultured Ruthenibacterium sp.]|uniref:alpha/beta hydrolase n=1 Tax=uncultured Ruthenibacterium sp. TaxID=1905347 RepID=UPI00349EA779
MKTFVETLPHGARLRGYLHEQTGNSGEIGWGPRPAMIICPGGGYVFTSPREADPPAIAFLNMGFQVFLLDYRVGNQAGNQQPMEDLARSILLVRSQAEEWNIDPSKLAVLGFSAGAHLAGCLGVHWNDEEIARRCAAKDQRALRPDAMVLCYPVITAGPFAHKASLELVSAGCNLPMDYWSLETQVNKETTPTFLWHTMDDASVPVENSFLFAQALHKAGVECECHFFPHGRHGLSVCSEEVQTPSDTVGMWVPLCKKWLENRFGPLGGL